MANNIAQGGVQSANIEAKNLQGLLPALDARAVNEPFVIDGNNFIVDFYGPKSAFYSGYLIFDQLYDPETADSFKNDVLNDIIIMTVGAALRLDATSRRFYPVYIFADDGTVGPWTCAVVNDISFYSKKGVNGIVYFNPYTNFWGFISATSYTQLTGPVAVAQVNERLVVLGQDYVNWSAQGDGTNLTPSLTTGAGFQGNSIIGGKGIFIGETDDGFIVYTTTGTYKGEMITDGSVNPFTFYVLNRNIVPVTAFCVTVLEDYTNLVIDKKGFYQSNGQQFTKYEQIFGEFLSNLVVQSLALNKPGVLKLKYINSMKMLFVSIQDSGNAVLCSQAYVLYIPSDKWGRFNKQHYNIVSVYLQDGTTIGYNEGYIDSEGYVKSFNTDNVDYDLGDNFEASIYVHYKASLAIPPITSTTIEFFTDMQLYEYDATNCHYNTGLYQIPTNVANPTIQLGDVKHYLWADLLINSPLLNNKTFIYNPASIVDIGSFVTVGLFRYKAAQYDDELGLVTNLALGVDRNIGTVTDEDWNTSSDAPEDWNTIPDNTDNEDWGANAPSGANFILTLTGSLDGKIAYGDVEIPTLENETSNSRFYSASRAGIWHSVTLTTSEPRDSFQLKLLELSGILIGRL